MPSPLMFEFAVHYLVGKEVEKQMQFIGRGKPQEKEIFLKWPKHQQIAGALEVGIHTHFYGNILQGVSVFLKQRNGILTCSEHCNEAIGYTMLYDRITDIVVNVAHS